jgi:hypothetical protein
MNNRYVNILVLISRKFDKFMKDDKVEKFIDQAEDKVSSQKMKKLLQELMIGICWKRQNFRNRKLIKEVEEIASKVKN